MEERNLVTLERDDGMKGRRQKEWPMWTKVKKKKMVKENLLTKRRTMESQRWNEWRKES